MELNFSTEFLQVTEHKKPDASILLEINLNNPDKLNVLNLDMILSLNEHLSIWQKRQELSAVFIHSSGDKAFCAGGDVAQMRSAILSGKKEKKDPSLAVKAFFKTEYETNYKLYHFSKPVVLWGNGLVIGGGMGLFMSSSHSILTENSLLSMPEILIGFFPDVGASYFLNQVPKGIGLYLALTACRLNSAEANYLNLSPWAFPNEEKQRVFDFLLNTPFKDKKSFEEQFKKYYKPPAFLKRQENWIKNFEKDIIKLLEYKDMKSFHKAFSSLQKEDKKWEQNRKNFLKGSPSSLALIFEQLSRAKEEQSLKSLFEMELSIALHIARNPDFSEGVRAMLVDKDKNPQWKPSSVADLDVSKIKSYFEPLKLWNCALDV